jgi:hypothetical protein
MERRSNPAVGLYPRHRPTTTPVNRPWECPCCGRINAWWVASCRCKPPAAPQASRLVVLPPSPISRLVAEGGELHPATRRCLDEQHRQWILRRLPVSLLDVEIGRGYNPPGLGIAGGTDVQGAQGVGQRRGQLERMGECRSLRREVMR